jgi:hypothetical protein
MMYYFSFGFALGRLPIPKELDVPRGLGTQGSCTAQAFLINTVNVAYIYAVSVSIYFLLIIRYKMSDQTVSKYIEPWMHFAAISWGYGLTWYVWSKELFNPSPYQLACWLGVVPLGCNYIPGLVCTRGINLANYVRNLYFIPHFIVFGSLVLSLAVVIITIRRQLVRNVRYAFSGEVTSTTSLPSSSQTSFHCASRSIRRRLSIFGLTTAANHCDSEQQGHLRSPIPDATNNEVQTKYDSRCRLQTSGPTLSSGEPSGNTNSSLDVTDNHDCHINAGKEEMHIHVQQLPIPRQRLQHSTSSSRHMLCQAATQSLCYGIAFSLCFLWTFLLSVISVFGDETKMLSQYFWVRVTYAIIASEFYLHLIKLNHFFLVFVGFCHVFLAGRSQSYRE